MVVGVPGLLAKVRFFSWARILPTIVARYAAMMAALTNPLDMTW